MEKIKSLEKKVLEDNSIVYSAWELASCMVRLLDVNTVKLHKNAWYTFILQLQEATLRVNGAISFSVGVTKYKGEQVGAKLCQAQLKLRLC